MSATRHSMLGPDSEMIDEVLLEQVDDGSRGIANLRADSALFVLERASQ